MRYQVIQEGMRLEDFPELMQHIQSRLVEKEAARTGVLSKSWLQAWATIPTLRFHVPREQARKQRKMVYLDRTLTRYIRDNIPIERFDLDIQLDKGESASVAENWVRSVATTTCLKELSLAIRFHGASFNLPDEILSGENVKKIRISTTHGTTNAVWMTTSNNRPPVINCVSLRELHLTGVRVSQQVLDHILSSCRLLVKIKLVPCSVDLNTIKVVNLPYLDELEIGTQYGGFTSVEISHVASLRLFRCNLHAGPRGLRFVQHPSHTHSISLGSSLTQLWLGGRGLVMDDASLDMIKSGLFPFLESLTLDLKCWMLASFHFTCASPVKRLSLMSCPNILIHMQVNARSLLFFSLNAHIMPSLSFPVSSTLEEIKLRLSLRPWRSLGASFFLNMREALELSSKCYIDITTQGPPLDLDLDDLRTKLQLMSPPAMNVQTLSFETNKDECVWDKSPFFDAFFEICHPKHVFAKLDISFKHNNHFCKLILREVLQNKTSTAYWSRFLKHVQISTRCHHKWETLSHSHTRFLDGSTPTNATFKLEWC